MIVHIGTKIQTLYGQVDAEGNVVKQFPVEATVQRLDQVVAAVQQIEAHKKKLEAELGVP